MNPLVAKLRFLSILRALAGALLMAGAGGLGADEPASFTVDARLGEGSADGLQVSVLCSSAGDSASSTVQSAWLPRDGTEVFELRVPAAAIWTCAVSADIPPGLEVRYRGDGGSEADIGESGCRFAGVQAGHANFCQIQARSLATSITVYKKWIGATREEPDVRVELVCAGERVRESRNINAGKPGGWFLSVTDSEGITCRVLEAEREEFIPDMNDCENLLILPGSEEECTLVNTKVVKMIDMLNRYGLVIMILVFMAAGMVAARRFVP